MTGIAALTALIAAAPSAAQFSDPYNFLKAVRDRDINKATELVNKPGTTIINTHDAATGETALHIAVRRHDAPWEAFALVHGADTGARDKQGDTALIAATRIGDDDCAEMLLKVGASPDLADARGETPLILAVQTRNLAIARLLVAYGGNPHITDHVTGQSALDYAKADPRASLILSVLQQAKPRGAATVIGPQP
ncbi:MAG: ankyrin repeat domain-containing protein [Sphingomonadaceae bacterium]|nr:ankyrin repeat domain-containing protein [Sphingomonadaceae bacterium]